ncbi:hypothetical protein [Methanosarcina barkeri]|uniref:hypothetical protein n=1 Tax=Methanosarcina barkeri TaxID=2208 RepID=UPI001FB496C9|nr:hypothetical protein [Methanosarcina barkeri]
MRYIPPTLGFEGWIASPPATAPMVCAISRMRKILTATLLKGCSLENGLIFVSVPGCKSPGGSGYCAGHGCGGGLLHEE